MKPDDNNGRLPVEQRPFRMRLERAVQSPAEHLRKDQGRHNRGI